MNTMSRVKPFDCEIKKVAVISIEAKFQVHNKSQIHSIAKRPHASANNIAPTPKHKHIMNRGQLRLTPAPGRLTPIGHGQIKAPPVCKDVDLKKESSSTDELEGVCFLPSEAERCAEMARQLDDQYNHFDDMPLNVDADTQADTFAALATERKALFVSSSSTVITTSSAGSGRSDMGNEVATMAAVAVKKGPPLEVVRTDADVAVNSEDSFGLVHDLCAGHSGMEGSAQLQKCDKTLFAAHNTLPAELSSTFTKNLIKGNSSRQGRSLQRWLVHSPTEELVRQVAGTIPITRDGRIILVSASRKSEWILPKGGWDADETKEECAARETFEEAGLLGRLGGCLEPIDYETKKSKKRRLSVHHESKGEESGEAGGARNKERLIPPLTKRVKTDNSMTSMPANDTVASDSAIASCTSSEEAHPPTAAAASTSLDPKNHSYVRLFLFPLYVSTVKSDWPEKGRLRKLVDIDEAIKIMEAENRQYFKRGLEMVKERGLHLVKPESGPK